MTTEQMIREFACKAIRGMMDCVPAKPASKPASEVCWACRRQDMLAGVQPDAELVGPDHIQSDYDAKIAERMGR